MPFCPTICPFCNFAVLERRAGMVAEYLTRIDRDLAELADRGDVGPLRSVYLGGGTPSHLRIDELDALLGRIRTRLAVRSDAEVTLEVHPDTVTADRARAWVDLGLNRLSVGVQSFDDGVLRTLGRPHDASAARSAVDACRAAGPRVLSIDLITTVDGQDLDAELDAALGVEPDHISAYTLTIEDGTPFARDGVVVDEDAARSGYRRVGDRLGAAGFEHYEVSNHARPGCRSVHNLAYWENRCFAGAGPGAASHLPSARAGTLTERRTNPRWAGWLDGQRGEAEDRDAAALLSDGLLCGLRLVDGVDLDRLRLQTGLDAAVERATEIAELIGEGLVEVLDVGGARRLRATEAGRLVLDGVTARLL